MNWFPAFIGIGAEKSATTWAWTMLNEHPHVCMSQPKELDFFNLDENFERGVAWYRRHFTRLTACTGEISPLYMDDHRVAERVLNTFPNARILVMLRNPFDRAMSHLFHDASVIYGKVAELTADDLQRLAAKDKKYVRRSRYFASLKPFFDLFPREQIGVFYFDDVRNNGLELAQRLYEFVGVDQTFVPEQFDEKVNESQDLKAMAGVVMTASRLAKAFPPTRLAMNWMYRRTQIREKVIRWLLVDKGRPHIQFREVFQDADVMSLSDDLSCLQSMLGAPVPATWLLPEAAGSLQEAA